jgi:plastocyanin
MRMTVTPSPRSARACPCPLRQPPLRLVVTPRFLRWVAVAASVVACAPSTPPSRVTAYTPRTRALTVTTVPLLVREAKNLYPFLAPAFAKGGVLDGKEVYGFSPSTLTVVEGDTIAFTFINPEDDLHSFVLPDLVVALPGGKVTEARYVARHSGIIPFTCSVASHLPMMSGQLVVLSPAAVASGGGGAAMGVTPSVPATGSRRSSRLAAR